MWPWYAHQDLSVVFLKCCFKTYRITYRRCAECTYACIIGAQSSYRLRHCAYVVRAQCMKLGRCFASGVWFRGTGFWTPGTSRGMLCHNDTPSHGIVRTPAHKPFKNVMNLHWIWGHRKIKTGVGGRPWIRYLDWPLFYSYGNQLVVDGVVQGLGRQLHYLDSVKCYQC